MMKKPAAPAPSSVTVSPAEKRRSRSVAAICSRSRSSRPAKSGTVLRTSAEALATAELYTENEIAEIGEDVPVKLTVIGCSPAWPNPGGAQSGYLVEGEGLLLLDCGPGVLPRLRAADGWPRVDALAITHFHLDHWGDLIPWIFGASFGPGRQVPKPELWLPPGGMERLQSYGGELSFAERIETAFSPREYEDGVPFRSAGFDVTPPRLEHFSELTFGMR